MAQLNFGGVTETVVIRDEFPLEKAREVLKDETIAVIGYGVPKEVYWYLIPFYNSVQCMNGIFSFDLVPVNFVVTIVANLLYALVMTAGLAKIFDSEKIMYS